MRNKLDYIAQTKRLLRESINGILAARAEPLLTESDPFEAYPSALYAGSPAPSAGSLDGSAADKLLRLSETKQRLREAINLELGIGLTAADPFRSYANQIFEWYMSNVIFGAGEQGAWYDPSDLTTLYQDAAGTTPVTADGDPKGFEGDKSGNGNHALQSISAARSVYKTDGSRHWNQFDAVDDLLDLPVIEGDPDNFVFALAVRPLAASDANPRYFGMVTSNMNLQCGYINDGTIFTRVGNQTFNTNQKITLGQPCVIQHIRQGGVSSVRINGIEIGFSSGTTPLENSAYTNSGVLGAGYKSFNYKLAGDIYGAIFRYGPITEEHVVGINRYLAVKAGVAL